MVEKITADLVLLNGKVVTMDPDGNVVEAVASKFGRVLAVGSNEEIQVFVGGDTKVVDVKKRLVLPGFIDSHVHPSFGGQTLAQVNFRTPPNKSIADCLERLQQRVEETSKGEWIICSGYNMAIVWPEEGRHMNRWDLDSVTPDNPVQRSDDAIVFFRYKACLKYYLFFAAASGGLDPKNILVIIISLHRNMADSNDYQNQRNPYQSHRMPITSLRF